MRLWRKQKLFYIYILMALTMIVCTIYLPIGHDMHFHIYRIGSIVENLNWKGIGGFPYRIYTTSFHGYGYGAPLFYGDIFLYFPALLAYINIDINLSYRIFTAIIIFLAFATMYGSVKSLQLFAVPETNRKFAVLAAMFYVYSPGFMENVWIRDAVGETLASIFLPITFCMIYKITVQEVWNFRHVFWLSIGISGLILSHVITTVIVAFFSIVFLILHIKKLLSGPSRILGLLLGGFLAFCLTAYWTIPFLEQYAVINLSGFSMETYVEETIPWKYWFIPYEIDRKLAELLHIEFVNHWSPSFIGYGPVLMLYLIFHYHRHIKKKELSRYGIFAFILLVLISIKPFNQWAGAILLAYKTQFPWRLLTMIFFLISLTISYILICLNKKRLIIIVSTIMLVTAGIPSALLYRDAFTAMSEGRIGCGYYPNGADNLYLPVEVDPDEIRSKEGSVFSRNEASFQVSRDMGNIHIMVTENKNNNTVLNVPFIYYKGYVAQNKDTGREYVVKKNSQGYLDVEIGSDTGNIIVYYRGTRLQKISNYISAASATLLFLYIAVFAGKSPRLQV